MGSFPKPSYLTKGRVDRKKGRIDEKRLVELEDHATREWIDFQEQTGVDILVDGEMYRGDMVAYFAEYIPGFDPGGLVRSYGNRYYHKPIIKGELILPGADDGRVVEARSVVNPKACQGDADRTLHHNGLVVQ